jgi:SAM-dependent methyltransferase
MSSTDQVRKDYDESADTYSDYGSLPYGILESQLFKIALGDPTGLRILDLGGGTGVHAREAIAAGAEKVDVLDISPEMLRVGKDIEASLNRKDRINCYEADVKQPLADLVPSLDKRYSVVMANWVFDHAGSIKGLEGMWRNIETYLEPGGLFIGVRSGDPESPALNCEKYGATYKWTKPIPGGIAYACVIHCKPPIEFVAETMELSYSGSTELHTKYGLVDVQTLPHESAEIVKKDPEFWKEFLERPSYAVVKGGDQEVPMKMRMNVFPLKSIHYVPFRTFARENLFVARRCKSLCLSGGTPFARA